MKYDVIVIVRGSYAAHRIVQLFPALKVHDNAPSFKKARPDYEPTPTQTFSVCGVLTSNVDVPELAEVIKDIGPSFVELRMGVQP